MTTWSSTGVRLRGVLMHERLIAVEAVDHPDERPDRPDVAARERVACDPHRPAQPIDLHMGVRGAFERLARFQELGDDLADAPLGQIPSSRAMSS